jgi:predicted permease
LRWLMRFFRKRRSEAELDAELRFHVEQRTADLIAAGVAPAEARRRAMIEFGGIENAKEECREARGTYLVESLLQDIRYGLRTLRKSPGFAIVAILTLTLGIGANTALFSIVNAVLLNPLPYAQPDSLVAINSGSKDVRNFGFSYPNFLDWRRENRTFTQMAAFRKDDFNLAGAGGTERVRVEMVSANFFSLLGIQTIAGRQFSAQEDRLGGRPVAMISEGFWKKKFGGDKGILGKTLTLNDEAYTIVGLIPSGFRFQNGSFHKSCDVYLPIGQWNNPTFRDRTWVLGTAAVGRLRPGVTLPEAQADMDAITAHLAEQYPDSDKGIGVTLVPLRQDMVGSFRSPLLMLLAAVGFVLLVVCANVANLLLARSAGRKREFGIRAALGASRGRVVRQLLMESLLLALAGGILALALAASGTQAALKVLPEALPRASTVHMDWRVLIFCFAVSLLTSVLFGLVPALKTSGIDLQEALKEGGRGSSGTRHRTQGILVASQMALAVVLLTGAGLMVRSLEKLWNVSPGFDANNVLTFSLSASRPLGVTPAGIDAALRQIHQRLDVVPGVQAASLYFGALPISDNSAVAFWLAGQPKPPNLAGMKMAIFYAVQPDYLKVMRIPLIRGRFLTWDDNASSRPVVVIDEQFARIFFGGQDPIGRRINLDVDDISAQIVGVVGHVKQWGLAADARSSTQAQMYLPISQTPGTFLPLLAQGMGVVVRTRAAPATESAEIRRGIEQFDGELAMHETASMEGIISGSLASWRFSMILLSVFAGMALVLSCIGIYGVVSYISGQRAHEISIRMALGADSSQVLRMVLGQGARMAFAGLAIGLGAALGLTWLMSRLLFGVSAHDPLTLLGVSILFVLVALAACYVPARRAARADPVMALRQE